MFIKDFKKFSETITVNVYAQSGEKDGIGKDQLYQFMERAYGSISNTDTQMEAGDLNVN